MAIAGVAARALTRRTIASSTKNHVEITKTVRQVGSIPRPDYPVVHAHLPFKYQNKTTLAWKIAALLAIPFSMPFAFAQYTHSKNAATA